jgi:hypothetical protein
LRAATSIAHASPRSTSVFFCLRSTDRIGAEMSAGLSAAVATWYSIG